MKNEIIQPAKHFDMHDDPLTHIDNLHLVIWNTGLSITGYSQNGDVLTTKIYDLPKADPGLVESIFINEPLVAGPQPVTHIWIIEQRHLIIPGLFFEEKAAAEWLGRFHFIETDTVTRHTPLTHPEHAYMVFPIQEKLLSLLERYFEEGKILPLSKAVLSHKIPQDDHYVDMTTLNETLILSFFRKGQLLSHQVLHDTAPSDVIYKIASIARDFQIPQDSLKIAVSGFGLSEELATELRSFFPKAVIPGSEQFSSFTLLSKLISCAS